MNDSTLDIKAFLDKDEQKDLLRLLTAGSVDDGKSTLIGRLLQRMEGIRTFPCNSCLHCLGVLHLEQ